MMTRYMAVLIGILISASTAWGFPMAPASAERVSTTDALLDTLQHTSFNFFWNEANPANGLIKDRNTPGSVASIASVGFGLSAICTGIDHGWITRAQGSQRVLNTLQTFWNGPQGTGANGFIGYKGLFYHWLDMNTAVRTWSSELSTIDSALLLAGILDAKQYFITSDPADIQIRALADSIYYRADWDFFRDGGFGIKMGWLPTNGFANFGYWYGYNEAMILYILALGSPTHPVPANAWTAWTSTYSWQTYYGQSFINFPPLFGHQYSHCWVDFRNMQDAYMRGKGIDYFENSRRATLAQQAYCIANPGGWLMYGAQTWGLTACDDPFGYAAHGAPPAQNDNGTIAPTAVAGSIAFAPEIAIPTLQYFWDVYRPSLWGTYGFKDAFNYTYGWWDTDVIGIDEGPIVMMIENYRTNAIWNRFMRNADIRNGLVRAGFTGLVDAGEPQAVPAAGLLEPAAPNPFRERTSIAFRVPSRGHVLLTVTDVAGREVARLADATFDAGAQRAVFDASRLASGVYFVNLRYEGRNERQPCVLIH